MPRSNGSGPVASVTGVSPVPTTLVPVQQGLSLGDAWRVIRGHAWLIVAMLCISAVAGFFINQHLERYYSRFTATGHIQFQPTLNYDPVHNPEPRIDPGSLTLELSTQTQLLRHDSLLTRVLTNPNSEIRKTAWFAQFPSAQAAKVELAANFSVVPIPGTRLIAASMTTPIARDSRTIVEELVQQHINDQKDLATAKQLERTTVLNAKRKELESRRQSRLSEIREKSVRLSAAGWDLIAGTNTKKTEELTLATQQNSIAADLATLQSRQEMVMSQLNRGEDPSELTNAIETDPNINQFKNAIDSIDMEVSQTGMGPENPRVKKLVAQRDAYAKRMAQLRGEKIASLRMALLEGLKNAITSTQQRLEGVTQQLAKTQQEVSDVSNIYRQYLAAKDEEVVIRNELKEITDSLDQITVQNGVDGGINWSTRPTIPDSPSFPKLSSTMTMAVMCGLGLALGIAFLRELTDTSVRSPRDITRIGQLNMLGMVSDINDDVQSAGAKLPLVIFEAPQAILAEQFRQVRTRMQHAASLDSTRSILVTSPGPGDGKSTIACNLAAGLALNGRRILLVDANFRRPELHKVFNLTNDSGFSDVLNQLDTLPQNIRESQVPNLAVLTSGPKPVNATELFESQLLVDFIEKALEEFDHVVFDSGPLLVVSETVALAPRVDGVVTVVRARHNSRGLLIRMRDTLRQLKAEHLGVILNGVRAQGGGYYGRNIKAYYAYMEDGTRVLPEPAMAGPTGPTSAA